MRRPFSPFSFSSSFSFFLFPFTFFLIPFVLLCTLNSAGYRYGASDLAFYIPAALERLDPSLFPRDRALIASQARLTMIDETIAVLTRTTRLTLPPLFAGLYVLTLALLLAGTWLVGRHLYRSAWTLAALTAAVTLKHEIAKSGTNTLEGYFHPRQLAFSLGTLALAAVLRSRYAACAALVVAAGMLHPTTALWFAIWLGIATWVENPPWRLRLTIAALLAIVAGVLVLTVGPLAGRLVFMDQDWLATLETKDYLFPLEWPLYVWLLNLAYLPTIWFVYAHRRAAGALTPGERGMVFGCLSLVVVFAAALPLNAARLAIVIQLQIPRIFWMLDFLAIVVRVLGAGRSGRLQPPSCRDGRRGARAVLDRAQRVHQVREVSGPARRAGRHSRYRLGARDGVGARHGARQQLARPSAARGAVRIEPACRGRA